MKKIAILLMLLALAAVAFGQGKVTLKYVSWMAAGEDKPVLEAFMKANPNIVVEDEILEGSKYQTLLKTRILGGDIPDVMLIMADQLLEFIPLGLLLDITNEPAVALQKKLPAINAAFGKDGKTYGFTVNGGVGSHPLWYNKVIFKKLGISEPKTEAEFLAACKKIKAAGIDPIAFGAKDTWPNQFALSWSLTAQTKVALEMAKTKDIFEAMYKGVKPSLMYKENFETIANYVKSGYISKASLSMSWPDSAQYFADGKAAMFPQGPWVPGVDSVKSADPSVFELGVFIYPQKPYNGTVYLRATSDRILVISAKSKNLDAARKLFNFFASESNLKVYLSTQTLTSLLPIQLDLPPVLNKFATDTQAKGIETGFLDDAYLPPGFSIKLTELISDLFTGESAEKVLGKLDVWYAEHKKDIKR
jgi:raffinose/stachyose/melibiose transport system substrate-binding protein